MLECDARTRRGQQSHAQQPHTVWAIEPQTDLPRSLTFRRGWGGGEQRIQSRARGVCVCACVCEREAHFAAFVPILWRKQTSKYLLQDHSNCLALDNSLIQPPKLCRAIQNNISVVGVVCMKLHEKSDKQDKFCSCPRKFVVFPALLGIVVKQARVK